MSNTAMTLYDMMTYLFLTLNLLTTTIVAPPSNASKWQMGFNSAFKGLTAIGLTPGGSSTLHIYKQTIYKTTQLIWEECGPCPVFASYALVFALQPRKNTEKPQSEGRRVPVGTMKTEYTEQNIHNNKNT